MLNKAEKISLVLIGLFSLTLLLSTIKKERVFADIPSPPATTVQCTCVTNNTQTCASLTLLDDFAKAGMVTSCSTIDNTYQTASEAPCSAFGVPGQCTGSNQSALIHNNGAFFNGTRHIPYAGDVTWAYWSLDSDVYCMYSGIQETWCGGPYPATRGYRTFPVNASNWTAYLGSTIGHDTGAPCRRQDMTGTLRVIGRITSNFWVGSGYPGDNFNIFFDRYNYGCY